ncbi:MAG: hypothetical protein NVS3B14_07660 [Ktedonobacteraceae bacterium]
MDDGRFYSNLWTAHWPGCQSCDGRYLSSDESPGSSGIEWFYDIAL